MLPVLLLLLVPYVFQSASARTFRNRTDVDTLLAFKASLSNQPGVLAVWNTSSDFCLWPGVNCSLKHKHRVTVVNLTSEGLAGIITPSIGNLTFLKILDLSQNNFHGEIPSSIGRLSRLRYLDLSKNLLHGDVNTDLKNCTDLESINLDSNLLTGEIPAWLGSLSNLKTIHLQRNNFTGIIPPSLTNLSALEEINFNENQLDGTIPEGLGRLHSLSLVSLAINQLSGTIPTTFFNLSTLIKFSVAQNELHGQLPSDLGNHLPELKYLFLGQNRFTGGLPASLVNATGILILDISGNNFTGRIFREIGMLCPVILNLERNQLMAATAQDWEFMTFLTNCTRLRTLDLSKNMLGSLLPSSVANLSAQLQLLYVGFNEISGNIPSAISNLVGLNKLQLSHNRFIGVLPDSIGRLHMLKVLGFENNLLTGFMPASLGNLTSLLRLFTDNNSFEGPLPTGLGNLKEINVATFSNNKLTGPFPKEIFNLSTLSYGLDLSGNYFVGPLPPEVGSLTKLAYLYISRNNLSGPLPNSLSNCQSLVELRLDHNFFSSSIPSSISKMRGLMLLNLTKNTLSGELPQELGLMSGLLELLLAHNNLSGHIPENLENMASLYHLDLSFNHLNGKVPSKGVFRNASSFSLGGNLGLCGGISELHLPPCAPESMGHGLRKRHFIITRLNIAVDIADALEYLHHNSEPPIVHCDLKPSNILLDENLVARVGDFGLAKILSEPAAEQLINSKSSTGIRGTIGYVAPEYGEGGQVSSCGDVYSFGSVTLELFTGMTPTHDMFRDGLTLQKHAENAFPGMLMQIVDPVLLSIEEANASSSQLDGRNTMEHTRNVILSVMQVALSCSKHAPTERMCMRDTAATMRRIRDAHVKIRQNEEAVIAADNVRPFAEISSTAETSRSRPPP